jgi:hypothetical protein
MSRVDCPNWSQNSKFEACTTVWAGECPTNTTNNTRFAPGKMAIWVVENISIFLRIFYKMTQE